MNKALDELLKFIRESSMTPEEKIEILGLISKLLQEYI